MKKLVIAVAVALVALTACTNSSNGSSNNGSSNNGSSNNGSSNNGSSNSNGGSSNNNGGSSNNGTAVPGGPTGTTAAQAPPPPPSNFTLPQPDSNGNVKVPDKPPQEVRNDSPRKRLSELPPIPTSCLDPDLTLLDIFAPFVSVPIRFAYCLLYIGTVARLPSQINVRVNTPSLSGPTIQVGLLPPEQNQHAIATLALVLLIIVVAVAIGYVIGRRRAEQ